MPTEKLDAIVIGELNIDLILWDVPMPEYEKEKFAREMQFVLGSSSAITAYNLASLDSKVGFIGKAGTDHLGDFVVQELQNGSVDTSNIIRDPHMKTGVTIVLANPPRKALLTHLCLANGLTIEDIDWNYVSQAKHLHIGSYFLQKGIKPDAIKIFEKAKSLGLTTSLDPNWDPEEKWDDELFDVLKFVDIFFPNEAEAIALAKVDTLEKAIEVLREKTKVLVVKCGQAGSILCTDENMIKIPGFKVQVLETTGAGDSLDAGFLFKYLNGADLSDCLKFGNSCGAIALTEYGGTQAFRDKAKLNQQLINFLKDEPSLVKNDHRP